jgi:hypothetical protein
MSEARRYQQLRAHFSYLKLENAAEALPRVLDQARAENLSMTAALELLEIEVNATEERRLSSRLRFACLPDPWTLGDFDFGAQPGVDEKLIRDLATLRSSTTPPTSCSSDRPGSARRCWPPRSPAARSRPAIGYRLRTHQSTADELRKAMNAHVS